MMIYTFMISIQLMYLVFHGVDEQVYYWEVFPAGLRTLGSWPVFGLLSEVVKLKDTFYDQ